MIGDFWTNSKDMQMEAQFFSLHDIGEFPLVRFIGSTMSAGYATQWCAEMDRLVGEGVPFVLIYPPGEREEVHEDRVTRGGWLKRNKGTLSSQCVALIVIEPDAERRAELEAMFPNLVKAFGTPQATRASPAEAESLARHLLAGGVLTEANTGPT